MKLVQDPVSKLILPSKFVDEKVALKKVIDDVLESCVMLNQHIKKPYFLILHARFNKHDGGQFTISEPVATFKFPPLVSNQMVFWIDNSRSICEMLWIVTKNQQGKLNVEFNKKGVAYLQAKGAMPS